MLLILHNFSTRRKPIEHGRILFLGKEDVFTCKILLESGYILDLYDTFYVWSYIRSLISVPKLDK